MAGDYYAILAIFHIHQRAFLEAYHRRPAATGQHKVTDEMDLWKATYNQISSLKQALDAYIAEHDNDDIVTLPDRKIGWRVFPSLAGGRSPDPRRRQYRREL